MRVMEDIKILWQLYAQDMEELWEFPLSVKKDKIRKYFEEFMDSDEESLEDFMVITYPEIKCERVFTNEIWL